MLLMLFLFFVKRFKISFLFSILFCFVLCACRRSYFTPVTIRFLSYFCFFSFLNFCIPFCFHFGMVFGPIFLFLSLSFSLAHLSVKWFAKSLISLTNSGFIRFSITLTFTHIHCSWVLCVRVCFSVPLSCTFVQHLFRIIFILYIRPPLHYHHHRSFHCHVDGQSNTYSVFYCCQLYANHFFTTHCISSTFSKSKSLSISDVVEIFSGNNTLFFETDWFRMKIFSMYLFLTFSFISFL